MVGFIMIGIAGNEKSDDVLVKSTIRWSRRYNN